MVGIYLIQPQFSEDFITYYSNNNGTSPYVSLTDIQNHSQVHEEIIKHPDPLISACTYFEFPDDAINGIKQNHHTTAPLQIDPYYYVVNKLYKIVTPIDNIVAYINDYMARARALNRQITQKTIEPKIQSYKYKN